MNTTQSGLHTVTERGGVINYVIENNKGDQLAYSERLAPIAELAQQFADKHKTPVYILSVRSREVISMRTPQNCPECGSGIDQYYQACTNVTCEYTA